MYCKYCGKQIDDDSLFCKYCGKQLEENKKRKLYNVTIYDNFQRIHDKFELNDGITFYELKVMLQNERFISTDLKIGSFTVYEIKEDNKVHIIFDESCDKNKNIDCSIFEKSDNPSLLINYIQDLSYQNPRDIVCLYGCPSSKRIKKNIEALNSKNIEVNNYAK